MIMSILLAKPFRRVPSPARFKGFFHPQKFYVDSNILVRIARHYKEINAGLVNPLFSEFISIVGPGRCGGTDVPGGMLGVVIFQVVIK
jgi:hypothetical protein